MPPDHARTYNNGQFPQVPQDTPCKYKRRPPRPSRMPHLQVSGKHKGNEVAHVQG